MSVTLSAILDCQGPCMPGVSSVALSDEQVRWFRARRSHLAGPGAPDPVVAARDVLGAQAQQLNPALWA